MNRAYLDSLPEVRNKYGFQLKDDEKVVFTCKLAVFGTSQGAMLGGDNTVFALTNQRIMANNGRGVWCVSISDEDIAGYSLVNKGKFIFKERYALVMLKDLLAYGEDGELTLDGFRFYFSKRNEAAFDAIMQQVMQ